MKTNNKLLPNTQNLMYQKVKISEIAKYNNDSIAKNTKNNAKFKLKPQKIALKQKPALKQKLAQGLTLVSKSADEYDFEPLPLGAKILFDADETKFLDNFAQKNIGHDASEYTYIKSQEQIIIDPFSNVAEALNRSATHFQNILKQNKNLLNPAHHSIFMRQVSLKLNEAIRELDNQPVQTEHLSQQDSRGKMQSVNQSIQEQERLDSALIEFYLHKYGI